jgi:alcohol dehydrogenase class IV
MATTRAVDRLEDKVVGAATMPVSLSSFRNVFPRTELYAGIGSANDLAKALAARGARRAVVVCGQTVSQGPQLRLLRDLLEDVIVDVYDGVRKHGGLSGAVEGARVVEQAGADALISLGGGSTIDSAKCIALILATAGADLEPFRVQERDGESVPGAAVPTTILHAAIPTTAGSSSEVMPWAGVRDEVRKQKMLFRDAALVPDIAVLDPRFVADTGPELTATSAMTSLARSVETLYSKSRQPISDALALASLRLMLGSLPTVLADGSDLTARANTQIAASLSGIAAENSMVSLVHAIGHAVGGRLALQHGIAHGILLAPAAEVCLPTLDAQTLDQVALALGVNPDAAGREELVSGSVAALRSLTRSLPLPARLRDVGVPQSEIDDIVDHTVHDPMFGFSPVPLDREQVRELLVTAW